MVAVTSNAYSAASGKTIFGGWDGPAPTWIPAEGHLANVGLNTLLQAAPSGWPNSDIGGPYSNWSGAKYCRSWGAKGSVSGHGSGHLSAGQPLWAGTWNWDLETRLFVCRNVPTTPLLEGSAMNSYGESTESATLGHTYAPHTYDGIVIQEYEEGGAAEGSLLRVCLGGSGIAGARCVHKFNLGQTNGVPTRVVDDCGITTSYPMTDKDVARGGFWGMSYDGSSNLRFVRFSDWSVTSHSNTSYNDYGDHSLVYIPEYDCLVGFGRSGSGGVNMAIHVCPIVGNVPQGWTTVSQTGTPPADGRCGGQWSKKLQKIVCYNAGGSYAVHKLAPSNPANLTAAWNWTSETLVADGGAVPSRSTASDNGAWGRFVVVNRWGTEFCLWCDSVGQVMQAWRLTGQA